METNSPCTSSCSATISSEKRIVKIEMEAAEVLASLATHYSSRETTTAAASTSHESESGGMIWTLKGKRPRNHDNKPNFSPPFSYSDPPQDRDVFEKKKYDDLCINLKIKTVKAEQGESRRAGSTCKRTNGSSCGSRSRQYLTEDEKEERRIRRVLANRESARQTIRRRHAICDELARKAVDLSLENENLKKEKELAEKEYESLKNINEYLKEQIATPIKSDEMEKSEEPISANVEMAASQSTNSSLVIHNISSCAPFVWPFIIRSSNPVQFLHEPENSTVVSPNGPMPSVIQSENPVEAQHDPQNPVISNANSSHEQEIHVNGMNNPMCLVQCHWFLPVPDHGLGLYHQPSFNIKHNPEETTVNDTNNASLFSQTLSQVETQQLSSPIEVTKEIYNLNETPVEFSPDGGGQLVEPYPHGRIFKPAAISPIVSAVNTKHENGESRGSSFKENKCFLPRKNEVPANFTKQPPEVVAAAAEARKRRKELTRLKNLRPFRINC